MSEKDINQQPIFAVAPNGTGDKVPLLVIGIPAACFEYMRDGKTTHFDLTKIGLPVKMVMFGSETHEEGMEMIRKLIAARGDAPIIDLRKQDFAIKAAKDVKPKDD